MGAKDTVMKWSQKFEEALVDALCRKYGWEHDEDRDNAYETIAILKPLIESNIQAQAEISFKERDNEVALLKAEIDGLGSALLDLQKDCIEARKAGIREVVEFENELLKGVPNYGWHGFLERRQAKLKEWGVSDG